MKYKWANAQKCYMKYKWANAQKCYMKYKWANAQKCYLKILMFKMFSPLNSFLHFSNRFYIASCDGFGWTKIIFRQTVSGIRNRQLAVPMVTLGFGFIVARTKYY